MVTATNPRPLPSPWAEQAEARQLVAHAITLLAAATRDTETAAITEALPRLRTAHRHLGGRS